jgi:ribosomal protein S25
MNTNKDSKNDKFINTKMNSNINMNIHSQILETIKREKIVTSSEIAKLFKISWNTAEKYLLELVIEGNITKIKKLGVNLWVPK